jgi:hypothetical protein
MKINGIDSNYIYAWCCDFSSYRGEGILALNFLKNLNYVTKKNIYAESPHGIILIKDEKIFFQNNKILKKKINFNFYYNYLYPFYGIFKIWYNYFNNKSVCYVNFLPFWNFALFLLMPRNVIYGPVTGSLYNKKVKNFSTFIRKFLIPIFYQISAKIVAYQSRKLIFSTEILKSYIEKKKLKYYYFNYNLINYLNSNKKNKKKDIDIIFYYRKYLAHDHEFQVKIIKYLAKKKYNIYVVGEKLNIQNVKNLGIISRNKLFYYLSRSRFSINEGSNFFSIFCQDCLSNGVKIFYDKVTKVKNDFLPKKYFLEIDFKNLSNSLKIIEKNIKVKTFLKKHFFNKKEFLTNYKSYFNKF